MPIIRRFYSKTLPSRQVATEVSKLLSGSNAGKSRAAAVTSNGPTRKRVTSAERRVMLESFVNKYRAMNLGKFPTPTCAQNEVGGGYYYIKKQLQEMEYNSKTFPVEKDQIKGDDALIAMEPSSQEMSSSQITIDQNICEDPLLESESNVDKRTDTENIDIATDETRNIASESDEKPRQNGDDKFSVKVSEPNVVKESDGIRNITREEGEKDKELIEKASLWGNLKSLANEFINMLKK